MRCRLWSGSLCPTYMNSQIKISLVVLAYNEAGSIATVVSDLEAALEERPYAYEIIVVNNGSSDDTQSIIEALAKTNPQLRVVHFEKNQGYGGGIVGGWRIATGTILGYMSGDNQYPARIAAQLAESLIKKDLDFVTSYRIKRHDGLWRLCISKCFQFFFNTLFGTHYKDINNNPKIFKKAFLDQLLPIEHADWFIDAEILWKISRQFLQYKTADLPMEFFQRPAGHSNVRFKTILEFIANVTKLYFK